jgi:hypothetical protein
MVTLTASYNAIEWILLPHTESQDWLQGSELVQNYVDQNLAFDIKSTKTSTSITRDLV